MCSKYDCLIDKNIKEAGYIVRTEKPHENKQVFENSANHSNIHQNQLEGIEKNLHSVQNSLKNDQKSNNLETSNNEPEFPSSPNFENDKPPEMQLKTETLKILKDFREMGETEESCLSKFWRFITCSERRNI